MKTIILILLFSAGILAQSPLLLFDSEIVEIPSHIANGTFDTGDNWDGAGGSPYNITNGVASYDNAMIGNLRQTQANMATALETSTDYTLSFDITGGTADIWFLSSDDNVQYIARTTYVIGHHSIDFTTPSNIAAGGIDLYTNVSAAFQIDNIRLVLR